MLITLDRYSVVKLLVKNDLPKDDTNLKIPIEQKIQYKIQSDITETKYHSRLTLLSKEKSDKDTSRFMLEVELEFVFQLDDIENVGKDELHNKTLLELLPYLSSYVGLLSALTGFPPMLIAKPDLNAPVNQK